MKNLLFTFLILAYGAPAFAQLSAPATGPQISFHNGVIFAGSGHDFRAELKDQGFGEPVSGKGFIDTAKNPRRNEMAVQLGILHPITSQYYVKALFNYRESDVSGYKMDFSAIQLHATSAALAALAVRYVPLFSQYIRLGVGPTFNRLNNTLRYEESELANKKMTRPGFVLETGFSTPASSRVYLDLQLQYFYAGKTDLGSHTLSGASQAGSNANAFVSFDKISLNSFIFSLGVGLRLQKQV
ncbi:hypothetical protein K3G39_01810 [Pontibacter sp. HSC-14F20]|uniref:hypothetical protein n=1 Tax=Pontibacter sp. HSC-14F20 TaxID=2864136 RepID=UPI001C73D82E|nr:hypothetical protein [Pontibacter sp. HSC-14F20]MBX0331967.1 hypothetical protein [Pontibacter sp. HSC-14F20]